MDSTSGLLYNGCDASLLSSGRRKRDIIPGCSDLKSTDPTLTTSLAQYICNFDGQLNTAFVDATLTGVASVMTARDFDTEFSAALSSHFGYSISLSFVFTLFAAIFQRL